MNDVRMRCPSCYRYGAPTRLKRMGPDGKVEYVETGNARDVVIDPECSWCHGAGHVTCNVDEREMADA